MIAEKIVFSVQNIRWGRWENLKETAGADGKSQAKKSQHPSWLNNTWKQCEQCRAFPASTVGSPENA